MRDLYVFGGLAAVALLVVTLDLDGEPSLSFGADQPADVSQSVTAVYDWVEDSDFTGIVPTVPEDGGEEVTEERRWDRNPGTPGVV